MSLKTYAIPFALVCKLCGEPEVDGGSEYPEDDDWVAADGGAATDAASRADAGSAVGDASFGDASRADAAADAQISNTVDGGADGVDGALPMVDASGSAASCEGPPGLYRDTRCTELMPNVQPYEPRFELWSDGAEKERYVVLPEGAVIDGADPSVWVYPVGTRLYKTFSRAGVKLETRVIEKIAAGRGIDAWSFKAYAWNAAQNAVEPVEDTGRQNVLGTSHDIPSLAQCRACHGNAGQDGVNGFSAIQLNHSGEGVTLEELLDDGTLQAKEGHALRELARIPGSVKMQVGLGVLHANCGHCHGGPTPKAQLTLRLSVGQLNVLTTDFYRSAVAAPLAVWTNKTGADGVPYSLRINPGNPSLSAIVARMNVRGSKDQMPPMGTEQVDHVGLSAVNAMIESLPVRTGL